MTDDHAAAEETVDHFEGRDKMLSALREELVGPQPLGLQIKLDAIQVGRFEESFQLDGPYTQDGNGEEILCVEPPGLRYGVGVLYPWGVSADTPDDEDSVADSTLETVRSTLTRSEEEAGTSLSSAGEKSLAKIAERAPRRDEPDSDDFDLSGANARRPNSMAVSFLTAPPKAGQMIVRVTGGRYEQFQFVTPKAFNKSWWLRKPVSLVSTFDVASIHSVSARTLLKSETNEASGLAAR